MLQSPETTFTSDSTRRRSTFYVPLVTDLDCPSNEALSTNLDEIKKSIDQLYSPDLSACSFEWSLDDSLPNTDMSITSRLPNEKTKRYGIVLNGIDLDDDDDTDCHKLPSNTSTPVKVTRSHSRSNLLSSLPDATTPTKEKSKTLPQNLSPANTFPPKHSFLLKSTPKISLNYSSSSEVTSAVTPSPKKSLSFIRRAHSTKLSRNNSLLKSLTSKCVDPSVESLCRVMVNELQLDRLEKYFKADNCSELVRDMFFKEKSCGQLEDSDVHSDTSYEKACRRGSAPATPILGQKQNESHSTSRFTNFFSKRSNPLKRTKSVTKLERSKRGPGGLRGSRSHESLLSSHAVMSTIDLSCTGAVGVAPVHQSVLGRRHCFQVRGGPRGERYYSCSSRQERDLWIYSLRKSIAPNADHTRRTDNSLKMWIYEAKALPPKKRYFCEINLDKTLYGRTSVKLRSDLLFWGEYFDFPDIPDINVITVNVFRELDKKKKRDKHVLVGSVKIPIHEVTSRVFSEDWYQIISEKHDSISRNSSKEQIPTLRIKCRFQSTDILPIEIYSDFLQYLKENYKKVCELLEPVIGVKAKEDIGQALVLLMHAQGMAGPFLTDVVALDLLRVGDQRLTFRGNSLATKSMEAFLKLTGEQYLQDTLSLPISEIISSDRDCEVDPLKATGSLSRQQQSLRNAVRSAWTNIAESHKHFPPQLRECFATFRERLQELNREDMADNLISASIFLRFLCPAILSPSLFNITSELPSARATRNLTLVAKTLQTLANFTRFQGKENFMEFLNDFLEQQAPKMKEFLHQISTRSEQPMPDTILDWSGYIDQGKQLSILYTLLADSIQKLPPNKQQELGSLHSILDEITKAKELNNFNVQGAPGTPNPNQENQPQNSGIKLAERGIIRGVLTPSSLEKNIFRYNDPTVSPLLNQHNSNINQSQTSINGSVYSNHHLQHSHSTSSISSNSNSNYQSHLIPTTIHHHHHHQSTERGGGQHKSNVYLDATRNYNTTSHYGNGSSGRKSPSIRASTLPRNNNLGSPISNIEVQGGDGEKNASFIQIGLEPSNAFVRKSPTPLLKSVHSGSRSRNLNGSQLSLSSDLRTTNKNSLNLNLNLGIPHSDSSNQQKHSNSNMPMNLEDLDDLLKYAEEHADDNQNKPKDILTTKGSNVSIGHCSSGYQSIATQSQSSSPVELGVPQPTNEYSNKNARRMPQTNGNKFPSNKFTNGTNSNNNNLVATHSPLAFKNPLYQMQNTATAHHLLHHSNSQKSSSLTPSSSEERLSNDNYSHSGSGVIGNGCYLSPNGNGGSNDRDVSMGSLNGSRRLTGNGRLPRTNPLMQYKRDDQVENHAFINPTRDHHHQRYQRRLSLESARTLSDSSTDTEGLIHTDGKRRRTPRSVEQCEREIQRLQTSLDSLRNHIGDSDQNSNDDLLAMPPHSDTKMRSIISRLITMEEELRREQLKMSLALSHKQRVIEAQGQQIAALDAANNRLLSALSSLRQRYETQNPAQPQSASGSNGNPASHC
ncbi:ras GTPase-activating protein raskol isoform X6 [Bradysia coprophila]|uniref:ras GTPase-activating protein raskol isoform X6 n=1 Tax=Bradysia coprophila TaxID=38358 RepID=UPI00187DC74F|nr:ras GTPase-activating protein raskol isoform X6 [Bradysia coprophila]